MSSPLFQLAQGGSTAFVSHYSHFRSKNEFPKHPLFSESLSVSISHGHEFCPLPESLNTWQQSPNSTLEQLSTAISPRPLFPPGQMFSQMRNIIPLGYKTMQRCELACRPKELKPLPHLYSIIYITLAQYHTQANKTSSALEVISLLAGLQPVSYCS